MSYLSCYIAYTTCIFFDSTIHICQLSNRISNVFLISITDLRLFGFV